MANNPQKYPVIGGSMARPKKPHLSTRHARAFRETVRNICTNRGNPVYKLFGATIDEARDNPLRHVMESKRRVSHDAVWAVLRLLRRNTATDVEDEVKWFLVETEMMPLPAAALVVPMGQGGRAADEIVERLQTVLSLGPERAAIARRAIAEYFAPYELYCLRSGNTFGHPLAKIAPRWAPMMSLSPLSDLEVAYAKMGVPVEPFTSTRNFVIVTPEESGREGGFFAEQFMAKKALHETVKVEESGRRESHFGGDPRVWMEDFTATSFKGRINPNPGAKRAQSEAPDGTPAQPAATKKPRKTKRP